MLFNKNVDRLFIMDLFAPTVTYGRRLNDHSEILLILETPQKSIDSSNK